MGIGVALFSVKMLFRRGLILSNLFLIGYVGCGNVELKAPPDGNEVWIQNSTLNPQKKIVKRGSRIKWVNKDGYSHRILSGTRKSPDHLFNFLLLKENDTLSFRFEKEGVYPYFCSLHYKTIGTIVVEKGI